MAAGRIALEFPAAATESGKPLSVSLSVRDTLPESPYRQMYVVFDAEATEPIAMDGRKQTERKVHAFERPIAIEVDLGGISTARKLSLFVWDPRLGHWWPLPTEIDAARSVARSRTWHFSSFGLGDDTQAPTPPQTLESFQTSLFTGTSSASYSIEVPPGTGGVAPKIALTYSSQVPDDMNETWAQVAPDGNTAGDNAENALQATPLGLGWSVELGAVFRRDDDTYRLMLQGSSYELALVDGSNPNDKRYRTREDQFWLIRRIQDPAGQHNSTGTYWLVRTKDGTEYRFGYNPNSDMWAGQNQGQYVAWASLLDRIEDTHGSYAEISYFEQIDGYGGGYDQAYYPSQILYTKNDGQGLAAQRKVVFNRADRTDYVTRPNEYQYYYKYKLDSVDVFLDNALVRKYVFQYDAKQPWWHKPSSDVRSQAAAKLLLAAIYQGDGTCPVGVVNGSVAQGNYLPPTRFTYYEGADAYGSGDYGKLHLKTVTNELTGGTITYVYERYTVYYLSGSTPPCKYRYRVTRQTNSGGAGTADVVRDFKYTWAWRDDTTGEFRGHDDVQATDTQGYQEATTFYTAAGANGKSQADCNTLRGKAYRESTRPATEDNGAVQSYGSDFGAAGYGRGGWTYVPQKFDIYTSGELKIGLINSTTYNSLEHAGKAYFAPSNTVITKVTFDWAANYDNGQIILQMDYPDHPAAWSNDQYGGTSGTGVTIDIPGGANWVAFGMFSRGQFTYNYPSDEWYGRISNLRIYYRGIMRARYSTWDYATTLGSARHIKLTQADEDLDWQPRRTRYTYDSYGNVTDVYEDGNPNVSGDERRKRFLYNVNAADGVWIVDRVTQDLVYDAAGQWLSSNHYTYDGDDLRHDPGTKGELKWLRRVSRQDGVRYYTVDTRYDYDAYGNRTGETTYTQEGYYDYIDGFVNNTPGQGTPRTTSVAYDATYHTFPYTITNPKSQVETRGYYAASGRIASVSDVNSQSTTYEHDSFKRLTKVRRPGDGSPGTPTVEYAYYNPGSGSAPRFSITTYQKTSGSGVYQARSWYDGLGRVVQTRGQNGAGLNPLIVDTHFDGRGLKDTQSVPYAAASYTWDYTSPDGSQPKTSFQYEGLRRASQITNPDSTARSWYYPGRTVSQVDERSHRRDLTSDPFDRLVEVKEYTGAYPGSLYATTAYSYDALDNLTQVADNAGNLTKMEYTRLSQLLREHDPDRSGSNDPNNAAYWWSYEYDTANNLTKHTDARGQWVEYAYDELSRLVRKYYPMGWNSDIVAGVSRVTVYDLIELRSAINVNRAVVIGEYTWTDPVVVAGRDVRIRAVHLTEMRAAIQGLWTAAGMGTVPEFTGGSIVAGTRVIKASDPNDLRSWLGQYEASGWAQGKRARAFYGYDEYDGASQFGRGRRTLMMDVSGVHRYYYDARGRLHTESQVVDGQSYVTQYTYDSMDRLATMTYPDGEVLTYSYDNHTRLTSIASRLGVSYLQGTTYNQLLVPKVLTLASGAQTTFTYWGSGLDAAGAPYGSLKGIYTAKGGLPVIQDLQHTYDSAGNLTRWQDSLASEDFTYEHDDLDRLTRRKITGGADIETFAYNQIGNITAKNGSGYTYDAQHVHGVAAFNGVSYTHDENGNQITAGGVAYAYDRENRIVKASAGGQFVARFAHDGDGKRVKRLDTYGTIHYVGGHYERNVGNGADTSEKITKYYYAALGSAARLIALRKNGTLYYVHGDHLGGTTRITDASGNIVDSAAYTAYGETRSGGTNLQTDRRFTGQILDQSTGLYWYSWRPYNPVLGRFIQPDTVVPDYGNPQGLNRYSYTLNAPLKYVDPSGHIAYTDEIYGSWVDQPGGNPTTPWELGWQWLTGEGPEEQVFLGGDPMTEELKTHSFIDEVRTTMAERAEAGDYARYIDKYSLGGVEGVAKYVGDYSNLMTAGHTGNLAVTFLGSYDLDSRVVTVDQEGGTAEVYLHVHNLSNLASATHPPLLGYTPFWRENAEPLINSVPSLLGGPLSPKRQHFYWVETIRLR